MARGQTPFDKIKQQLLAAFMSILEDSYSYFQDGKWFNGLDLKQADALREYCYKKYNIPKGKTFYIVATANNVIKDNVIKVSPQGIITFSRTEDL